MSNPDEYISVMIESDEAFRSQFDPSSQSYHNGDPTPVPLGGERVPESMPTAYDPNGYQQDTPMDPAYYYLSDARNLFLNFKKALSQICPNVEAVMRARKFKDPVKKQQEMEKRHMGLLQSLEVAQGIAVELSQYVDVIPDYGEVINEVFQRGLVEYNSKDEYGEYMRYMTLLTQRVFKDSQDILMRMKVIKSQS
ncbi:unnamed protein product [Blepharisma stoltei]|uniref:Uncharacterized protein n=1 Tax=Blepharisma stoltei TaxID=1481888 RepID=A0AAU9K033_9CILI|nr:unnamed protein product [Blepharisma stoltei]